MYRAMMLAGNRIAFARLLLVFVGVFFRIATQIASERQHDPSKVGPPASKELTETTRGVPAGNIQRIPANIIRGMGGESTISQLKAFLPGNQDLYYDPRTGDIYVRKPSGGFSPLDENVNDYLSNPSR
jgi:hypothetical protein